MEQMPTLTDDQVESYFTVEEEVPPWAVPLFDSLLGDNQASFQTPRVLDLGGGTGRHLDAILAAYPSAEGVLLDSSEHILRNNRPHPRKQLIRGNIADLQSALPPDKSYDLMTLWCVLHHCIGTSVSQTRRLQRDILSNAAGFLAEHGRLIVIEVCYESYLLPKYASRMIYHITRSRLLAPIARRFEANTAGTGVLFATEKELEKLFGDAGLAVEQTIFLEDESKGGTLAHLVLGLKSSYAKTWILRRAD